MSAVYPPTLWMLDNIEYRTCAVNAFLKWDSLDCGCGIDISVQRVLTDLPVALLSSTMEGKRTFLMMTMTMAMTLMMETTAVPLYWKEISIITSRKMPTHASRMDLLIFQVFLSILQYCYRLSRHDVYPKWFFYFSIAPSLYIYLSLYIYISKWLLPRDELSSDARSTCCHRSLMLKENVSVAAEEIPARKQWKIPQLFAGAVR